MDDIMRRKGRMLYDNHSRKSKSGLSIFKKRLKISKIYKRLGPKLSAHSRNIRALTNSWNVREIKSLVDQYEITSMLKSLSDSADDARLIARNASQDFLKLRKAGFLCDLTIVTKDQNERQLETTQVHGSLFCKRTGLVLNKGKDAVYDTGNLLCLPPHTDPITCTYSQNILTFSSQNMSPSFLKKLLLNIYSENESSKYIQPETLNSVSSKKLKSSKENSEDKSQSSKTPLKLSNKLSSTLSNRRLHSRGFSSDMRDLYLSANASGDIRLACVSTSNIGGIQSSSLCHSFVLAARSGFLKSVIEKQKARSDEMASSSCPTFTTIQLESKVFSPKYLPVVLYSMYTDEVDLQRISKGLRSSSDLDYGENIKDLMEILYLGRFLEFPHLIQACEDLIATKLNSSNTIEILRWSSKPHGSPWLRRKVIQYIRDNLTQISGGMSDLTKEELCEVIRSDYVNAPEFDILKVVLDWGEHELIRNIEAREPNLVQTHITLNPRSRSYRTPSLLTARRHELLLTSNSEELHDCTADLLSDVRLSHILPPNHEIVTNAMKRGVISSPPEHLLEWHHPGGTTPNSHRAFFWLRDKAGLGFSPPRLFTPHWVEAKAILEDRICQESSGANVTLRSIPHNLPQGDATLPSGGVVPDALYMVGSARTAAAQHKCDTLPRMGVTSLATTRLKYINKVYPVPDPSIASKLLSHERRLRRTPWVKEILQSCHSASVRLPHCCCRSQRFSANALEIGEHSSMLCNLCRAEHYIRLTCVREQNLPDATSDILRRPHLYYDPDDLLTVQNSVTRDETQSRVNPEPQMPQGRLQKLFQKRTKNKSCDMTPPITVHRSWNRSCDFSSNSDLSDDGNSEWPFPYINAMQSRSRIGHDSDSSISVDAVNASIPDVAASADSTIKSLRSLLSSSSNSDSVASVPFPGDLFLRQGEDIDENVETEVVTHNHKRKASVSLYAQYLSMKKAPKNTASHSSSGFRLYPKPILSSTSVAIEKANPASSSTLGGGPNPGRSNIAKTDVLFADGISRFSPTNNVSAHSQLETCSSNLFSQTGNRTLPDDIHSNMLRLNMQENDSSVGRNFSELPSCSYTAATKTTPDICSSVLRFIDAECITEEGEMYAAHNTCSLTSEALLPGETEQRKYVNQIAGNHVEYSTVAQPKVDKPTSGITSFPNDGQEHSYSNKDLPIEDNTMNSCLKDDIPDRLFPSEQYHQFDRILEESLPGAAFLINETLLSCDIDKETTL